MVRIWLAALLAAWAAFPLSAKGPGSTGADFLNIAVGPRQVGMGDQGAALAEDAFSLHYNPAGIALLEHQQVSFMHNQWIEGISQQYAGWAYPSKWINAGASLNFFHHGTIQGYDAQGGKAASFSAEDIAASFGLAGRLLGSKDPEEGASVYGGVSGKFIQERLETNSASASALDVGLMTQFYAGETRLRLGLVSQNMGRPIQYYQKSSPLPSKIAIGASVHTRYFWGDPLTLAVELRQAREQKKQDFSVGAEYWLNRLLALRAGYKSQEDLGNDLRFGMSLKIKIIQFDYGMSLMDDFGLTHRAGITVRFGEPVIRTPGPTPQEKAARKALKKAHRLNIAGRNLEAILEVNKALELVPGSPEALEFLKNLKAELDAPKSSVPDLKARAKEAKKALKRAKRLNIVGRNLEALLEINKALELDPSSPEALALLKTIKEQIQQQEAEPK